MSSTPEFNGEQLAAVRAQRWHQGGDALLTHEAARDWLGELGLVLFAPRAQQLPAPAPSFVEATLGRPAEAPTPAESETARGLVSRLVADGSALPLNLLGGPGDLPDFMVTAQVFSYVFTLRGDKSWKQPPSTSGPVKVSPLALKVYEVLAERGALTAAELVSELGRELTENAIARSLSELWQQLRVLPLLQQDGSATMWELTSRRFTKAIKAGANAGQPTALSALISLYLAQAYAATEDEIETFLSPLAARSRVHDVLHGLTAGRQLENAVLEGKTLLYIPGALPEFPELATEQPAAEEAAGEEGAEASAEAAPARIRSFAAGRKPAGDLRGRPARPGGRPAREGGVRPTRRTGDTGRSDRERRPFRRDAQDGAERPGFTRPWDEDRKPRPRRDDAAGGEERRPSRPRFDREAGTGPRREAREGGSDRGGFKPRRFEGGERASRGADRGGARGPARGADRGADRGPRAGGFAAKRPFVRREDQGGERPYKRRENAGEERGSTRPPFERGARPERGAKPGGFGAKRPYASRDREGGERPYAKRPYKPREEGGAERPFAKRPYKPREEGGGERPYPKRPYTPREEGGAERSRPRGEAGYDRGAGAPARKSFGPKKFGAGAKFGGKPGGGPGGRPASKFGSRPGGKPGGRPAGKFGSKPKSFGTKPGGFGAKRGGAAGGSRPAPRKPETEE